MDNAQVMPPPARNGKSLKFPDAFLWGTATSTTQIEGHVNNEWTGFVARDGNTCGIACNSYHKYAEDIQWMRQLGVNSYRMGVEWSRLQDKAQGPLHQAELARYVDQLDQLNAAGIVPMVVLHHFSNPPWINDRGGWTNAGTIPAFVDYVTKLAAALRGRVRFWNTFNEPDTYASCGYLIGEFPPLKKGRLDCFRAVIGNMAEAHERVCRVLRQAGSSAWESGGWLLQELDVFPTLPDKFTMGCAPRRAHPFAIEQPGNEAISGRGQEIGFHLSGRQLLRADSFQEPEAAGADGWVFAR